MAKQGSFSGRQRRLTNRASVKLVDTVARAVITVAGVGTIAAVSTVFLFLLWVVFPLFGSTHAKLDSAVSFDLGSSPASPVKAFVVDEQEIFAHFATADGRFATRMLDNAKALAETEIEGDAVATDICHPPLTSDFTMFKSNQGVSEFFVADNAGGVRIVSVKSKVAYPDEAEIASTLGELAPGEVKHIDGELYARGNMGLLRRLSCEWSTGERMVLADRAIDTLSVLRTGNAAYLGARLADHGAAFGVVSEEVNQITDEITYALDAKDLTPHLKGLVPKFVVATQNGREAIVLAESGRMLRFDMTRYGESDFLMEDIDTLTDRSSTLTAVLVLQGGTTLMLGDSTGGIAAWFAVRSTDHGVERTTMKRIHVLPSLGSPVTRLARSINTRVIAAGSDDGKTNLYHVTSRRKLASLALEQGAGALAFSPSDRMLLGCGDGKLQTAHVDLHHVDASWNVLFSSVWYEGYERPEHVWQAAAGSEIPEPKYGFVPLVFGTLKATFYSMLFAAPLALLAALYTSEFLPPKYRLRVKPVIELMAGLPSVVLGYIAAMILAPIFERDVARFLTMLITGPLGVLVGAQLWLMLPHAWTLRWERWKLVAIAAALFSGAALAWPLGPVVEQALFSGNIKLWLNGRMGSGFGGWLVLFLPLSLAIVLFAGERLSERLIGARIFTMPASKYSWIGMGKLLLGVVAVFAISAGIAGLLTSIGWDSRGGVLDTYVQRNALIVGAVMGFAVIPIIYTIAEDALSTVPQHLRSASLGAGATPWQTAVRVVVPTAMSGLFSALMIGLGRAVGETMIVVMATGNSPIMSWNAFNGLRTLSATIATEMPDADPGSSHYRLLFLAALTLFCMTFVVNTLAEMVRLRFRKRAYQL